jgi:4-amino-4-deoxy-L-arabinose transferase-like glycosyltransferase
MSESPVPLNNQLEAFEQDIKKKGTAFLVVLIILSITGSIFIAWCMRKGPSGWSDSVAYLVSARNIIKGIGIGYYFPNGQFYTQIIHAPLYIVILALIGILKVDLITCAQVLNILFFGGTIFLAGLIFYRYSNQPWLSVIACLAVGTFPVLLQINTSVMTEPLFLFLYFLSIYFLFGYLKENRKGWLILSAITTGLLPATRYVGMVFILTNIIFIIMFSEKAWLIRLKAAFRFGLISLVPISIWGIYLLTIQNDTVSVNASGFNWSQMLNQFGNFRIMTINVIWKWVPLHEYMVGLKSRAQFLVILGLIISIAVITYFAKRISSTRTKKTAPNQEYILFCVFGLSGLGLYIFMIITYIFFQLPGRLDDRQLLPVFLSCVLAILSAAVLWMNAWLKKTGTLGVIAEWGIVLGLLFISYPQYFRTTEITTFDQGILASAWRESETVHAVAQIPTDKPIISNNAAALLLWADRPAYDMFESLDFDYISQTTPYGSDENDRAQIIFNQNNGVLVVFNNFPTQMSNHFYEQGTERLNTIFSGLVLQNTYHDGSIYFPRPADLP